MNQPAYQAIIDLLDGKGIAYAAFSHEPCKTSEESAAVRAAAGYPGVIGAKALLTKLYFSDREIFATIVLPGNHVLDKEKLITGIPGLKKIRFATPEEMQQLACVVPGCMPPFAKPLFPEILMLIVAQAITVPQKLGFNAAYLERSVVLDSADYMKVVTPTFIIDCSVPK